MESLKWKKITQIQGRLEAELIESFLEAHGVDVELIQESIGHSAYPVTINGLGRVQVFVPMDKFKEAQDLLSEYEKGSEDSNISL